MMALERRVAGLYISQVSGIPGANLNVWLRGQNSVSNGNGGISPFSILNPADIESIEILKDADATAIYGSRGANGVILITTKKGKAGATRLDINLYSGFGALYPVAMQIRNLLWGCTRNRISL